MASSNIRIGIVNMATSLPFQFEALRPNPCRPPCPYLLICHRISRRLINGTARHLRGAIDEYIEHYHVERTHQGLDNRLVDGVSESGAGPVQRHERLGGLLSSYYREAA